MPKVTTFVSRQDRLGMWKVRWGIGRMRYLVPPGLYVLGNPDGQAEVLVTANYRLTFDVLRGHLEGIDAWVLVLDTGGVNVWCAAGKGTFGTRELVERVRTSGVEKVVAHRRLILPQLAAPGVAAHRVREDTGFSVVFGPVEARHIPAFLREGRKAQPFMRRKEFPLAERAALVPMELIPALKWVLAFTVLLALMAGALGRGSFFSDATHYGLLSLGLLLAGAFSGAVLAPLLLPWIPGRAFALKGVITGGVTAVLLPLTGLLTTTEVASWALMIVALSSFLAMNFTGSSTYTSLSGVRKEMREAVPFQIVAGSVGLLLWAVSLFVSSGGPL